jgi:phosphoadenosine phosphosulfate reductase
MTATTNIPPAVPSLPDLEGSSAGDVVAWALAEYHPSIALACSFQKEESVLLDLLFRANPDARVFALDTGLLFDETYELWRRTEERYDTKIERWQGPTLAEQAKQYGDKLWASNPSQCCGIRKVAPLREGLSQLNAWITGIRRDQSPARAGAAKVEWDDAFDLVKVNPLADWSDKDVWRYVFEHDLPYNPLHDQGYSSIGCTPCTNPGEGREGRWAGSAKVECGLHQEDA